MATVVRMPAVLAGATEATIARWLVAPGDPVEAGAPVAEIETEKALVEYQAQEAGTVGRLLLAEGETGGTGDPILVLVAPGEDGAAVDAALAAAGQGTAQSPAPPLPPAVPPASPAVSESPAAPAANGHQADPGAAPSRVFASPLVRKIAGEKGIDLRAVEGTGPNGRITRRDLERLAATRPAPAPPPAQLAGPPGAAPAASPDGGPELAARTRLIPHTPMRRAIARRLTESVASIPHFFMTTECVVDEMLALRERVNETAAARVSVNDFVIMAAAAAYADVPEANVTWADEGLIAHDNVDISIAVATEGGLVTPVLRDAGRLRLTEVARQSRDLAQRARDRRLLQHELEGGVLSVSNLGMYGTLEFSAIINPPQSAILAVGAARQQPVAAAGAGGGRDGAALHLVGRPPRDRRRPGGPLAGCLHRPHGKPAGRDRLKARPLRLPGTSPVISTVPDYGRFPR